MRDASNERPALRLATDCDCKATTLSAACKKTCDGLPADSATCCKDGKNNGAKGCDGFSCSLPADKATCCTDGKNNGADGCSGFKC